MSSEPRIPLDDVALGLIRHAIGGVLELNDDGEPELKGADMSLPKLLDFWAGLDETDGHWEGDDEHGRFWVCHQPSFHPNELIEALVDEIERLRREATDHGSWTVTWRRSGEEDWLTCSSLDERTALARLIGALRHSDHIEIKEVRRDPSGGTIKEVTS